MNGWLVVVWTLLAALPWCIVAGANDGLRLEIQASSFDREKVPVFYELPAAASDWKHARLIVEETDKPVPCQIQAGEKPQLVFMLEAPLKGGESRRYRLRKAEEVDDGKPLKIARDDRTLTVTLNDKPVLVYNHAVVPSDDPKESAYRRSGFIHPLYDPQGHVVSDGMPPDHMHQHGIMYAWVNTSFRNHAVDFWNSAKHEGEVRHKEVLAVEEGPVFARFRTSLEHVDLTERDAPRDQEPQGTIVLRETWQVTVFNRADGFLFDIESEQSCATDDPLVIRKYHYGGMAFRGARPWHGAEGCGFLTSEGKDRASGNHTTAWWCDISGNAKAGRGDSEEAGGTSSGLTVFCAPGNLRAPQAVRLHPTMPYFVWSPMVDEGFQIDRDHPYKARYRYFVHTGAIEKDVAEPLSQDFRNPAKVVRVE